MLSRALKQVSKTLGFRLVLWYSGLFILSSIILFVVAVFLVSSTFRGYDHQILQTKINEYTQLNRSEGIAALVARVRFEEEKNLESGIFIRLANPGNQTVVSFTPHNWTPAEVSLLEGTAIPASGEQWEATVPRERGDALVLIGRRLSDGSILQAAKRPEVRGRLLESFPKMFAGILAPVILLGIAGGLFLSFRALRPIRDLIDTVHSIAGGRMDARVPSRHTGDELDELVLLFNGMLSRIESLINGMRESLDNVAHDLRTPITRLRNVIETAVQSDTGEAGLREALMDTAEEAERINTVLATLMDISEAEKGIMALKWEKADLVPLIRQVIDLYQYSAEDNGVTLAAALPDELPVWMDSNRIRQVVANLLDNAVKFTPAGGRIDIAVSPSDGGARITVADTGVGIPEKDLPRIFERLFRGEKSRSYRGLGLGLSIVQAVVRAHHGRVEVQSLAGRGSTFDIFLPHADAPPPDPAGSGLSRSPVA
jgi:signal transduction histidine kinase